MKHILLLISVLGLWGGAAFASDSTFVGIGIVLSKDKHHNIHIDEAIKNGPAYRAGVRDGELIRAVDAANVSKMSLSKVVKAIRGAEGTPVALTLDDGQGHERTVSVVREKLVIHENCFIEGTVQLRLSGFNGRYSNAQGFIGNQGVNWIISGSYISGIYNGETISLNLYPSGSFQTIQGYIHNNLVRWSGTNGLIIGYQNCIR